MQPHVQQALSLAQQCWKNTYRVAPDFCEAYLEGAAKLLSANNTITGEQFKYFLQNTHGLNTPKGLTDNVWPSGVNALRRLGWITRIGDADPVCQRRSHNSKVSLWRSNLYGKNIDALFKDRHAEVECQ